MSQQQAYQQQPRQSHQQQTERQQGAQQVEHQQAYQQSQQRLQQASQGAQQLAPTQQSGQPPLGAPVFRTTNFLPQEARTESVQTLNQVLADTVVLVSQVKAAHWNVRGPEFYQLHELFEDVAEAIEAHVDEIAERATALGGTAKGTVREAAQATTLPPMPQDAVAPQVLLQHVAEALSALDAQLYQGMERIEQQGDLDTVDLLNEVSRDVSKSLWFVEAHLQRPQQPQGAAGQQAGAQTLQQ